MTAKAIRVVLWAAIKVLAALLCGCGTQTKSRMTVDLSPDDTAGRAPVSVRGWKPKASFAIEAQRDW